MYPLILCTCGRSLGDLYPAFKAMRADLNEENNAGVDPHQMQFSEKINIELGPILDKLCLFLMCCRTRIMQQVEIKEYY